MTSSSCVVCSQPADVYCRQDSAALCNACDQQVHSANPLASRHTRVPIATVSHTDVMQLNPINDVRVHTGRPSEPESDMRSSPGAGSVDDDAFFTVPDVDAIQHNQDDTSPFISKNYFGKSFLSDDLDLGEIDPSWLDRLDCGVGSMPSDFLDSLVPEEPPVKRQSSTLVRTSSLQAANVVPEQPSPQPDVQAARNTVPIHLGHPASGQQQQAVHFMPAETQYYAQQVPQMVPFQPQGQPSPPPQPLLKLQPGEIQIDIDNYVPCSLRPLDPQTRAALLHARHTKLQRFRDKKRNRHFKKTIRYASRKAYAEVRPRIKGRFARKDEVALMRANGTLPAVE